MDFTVICIKVKWNFSKKCQVGGAKEVVRRGRRIQPAKGQGGPLDPHLKLHHQLVHPAGQGLVLVLSPEPCLLSPLTGTAIFLKITVSVYGIIKSGCGVIMDAYGVVKYGCTLMATVARYAVLNLKLFVFSLIYFNFSLRTKNKLEC